MQGVEILTTAQVAIEWAENWLGFWIVFSVVVGICLAIGIRESVVSGDWSALLFDGILGAIIGVIIGVLPLGLSNTPTAYETQYKVTISEEVSMAEFYEHYEVVEQDGKIFTVREKTNESN